MSPCASSCSPVSLADHPSIGTECQPNKEEHTNRCMSSRPSPSMSPVSFADFNDSRIDPHTPNVGMPLAVRPSAQLSNFSSAQLSSPRQGGEALPLNLSDCVLGNKHFDLSGKYQNEVWAQVLVENAKRGYGADKTVSRYAFSTVHDCFAGRWTLQ